MHSIEMQQAGKDSASDDDQCCGLDQVGFVSSEIAKRHMMWTHVNIRGSHVGIIFYEFRPWRLGKHLYEKRKVAEEILKEARARTEKEN
jgi:hypothetical protein